MSVGNLKDNGNKGSNFPYQLAVLKLLEEISNGITSIIPGIDYETRTTMYQATANGPGYSTNDIIIRYDIINVATSTVVSTLWFNQNTQTTIAAPAPGNLTPYTPGGSVTVSNPFNLEATQLLVLAQLTAINANLDVTLSTRASETTLASVLTQVTAINADLDVALSTRASEATLATRASEATLATRASEATLATMLTLAGFQARINTLGQKTMANSTPVVLASDQSSIEVKGTAAVGSAPTNPPLSVSGVDITTGFKEHIPLIPISGNQALRTSIVGISRTPSVVLVPASTALTNTVAGKQETSLRVTGNNGTIGGVAVPNGTTLTFRAAPGDTVGSISYQTGAATTILITYLT